MVESKKGKPMDWIDRMQIAYEAQTDRMIDEMYGPRSIECAMCEEYFNSDNAVGTKYEQKLDFCSDDCVEAWEEEFAHDYEEEEEELDNQSTIHPVFCTTSHTAIQKVG
jgi:hypothetical protein